MSVREYNAVAQGALSQMSDQPKPTGEWTGIDLSRLIQEKGYQGAAGAINAALAAELKKLFDEMKLNKQLREQIKELQNEINRKPNV